MPDEWWDNTDLLGRDVDDNTHVLNRLEPVGGPFVVRGIVVFKPCSGGVGQDLRRMSMGLLEAVMGLPQTLLMGVRERSLGEAP